MNFPGWLAEQRHGITALRVESGDYIARYSPRTGTYSAALRIGASSTGTLVQVSRAVVVRVRVTLDNGGEYEFEPSWVPGLGLNVRRLSPCGPLRRDVEPLVKGLARAALLAAAESAYDRLCALAVEADEERWEDALIALTSDGSADLDQALRASVVAALARRTDGAQLERAPRDCQCVGCDRKFAQWDRGPLVMFGDTAVCVACLPPTRSAAARAA